MRAVCTMGFSTPDGTSHPADPGSGGSGAWLLGFWRWGWLALMFWAGALWAQPSGQTIGGAPESASWQVYRTAEGLVISAQLDLALPPGVEEGLMKGVPIYFVALAEVTRSRWYWSDKRLARQSRTYRLAYQPLTRQWRVSVAAGTGPAQALEYALHQNHGSLASALRSIARLRGWLVAGAEVLADDEAPRWVDVRFWLDPTLLPRPFQIGLGADRPDKGVDIRWRAPVPDAVDASRAPSAPEADGSDDGSGLPPLDGLPGGGIRSTPAARSP